MKTDGMWGNIPHVQTQRPANQGHGSGNEGQNMWNETGLEMEISELFVNKALQ